MFLYHPSLWAAPAGMVLLGALAGLLPAAKAYRTDVAENLAPAT
jgi:putative ABC transport system permease protein